MSVRTNAHTCITGVGFLYSIVRALHRLKYDYGETRTFSFCVGNNG